MALALTAGLLTSNMASASANLKVPTTIVTAYVEGADDSFYDVTLSGVPTGFSVGNLTYGAYCISYYSSESPVGTHPARLYDSTGFVPAAVAENYGYINYILNNKQGTADDVQAAIWYFTDGVTWDLSAAAQAMIQAALTYGLGYQPGPGDVTAVVVHFQDDPNFQPLVIEVPTPAANPCDDFVTGGGFIMLSSGARGNFGVHGGIRRGAFWGGLNYIDHGTRMHVKSTATTGYTVINDNTRQITFNVKINGVAGSTAVVTVTDNGEPGTRDIFEIRLSNGYAAGNQLGGTARRGGGGNIQLHKSKCRGR
jgi:hypothetical protein